MAILSKSTPILYDFVSRYNMNQFFCYFYFTFCDSVIENKTNIRSQRS